MTLLTRYEQIRTIRKPVASLPNREIQLLTCPIPIDREVHAVNIGFCSFNDSDHEPEHIRQIFILGRYGAKPARIKELVYKAYCKSSLESILTRVCYFSLEGFSTIQEESWMSVDCMGCSGIYRVFDKETERWRIYNFLATHTKPRVMAARASYERNGVSVPVSVGTSFIVRSAGNTAWLVANDRVTAATKRQFSTKLRHNAASTRAYLIYGNLNSVNENVKLEHLPEVNPPECAHYFYNPKDKELTFVPHSFESFTIDEDNLKYCGKVLGLEVNGIRYRTARLPADQYKVNPTTVRIAKSVNGFDSDLWDEKGNHGVKDFANWLLTNEIVVAR